MYVGGLQLLQISPVPVPSSKPRSDSNIGFVERECVQQKAEEMVVWLADLGRHCKSIEQQVLAHPMLQFQHRCKQGCMCKLLRQSLEQQSEDNSASTQHMKEAAGLKQASGQGLQQIALARLYA